MDETTIREVFGDWSNEYWVRAATVDTDYVPDC